MCPVESGSVSLLHLIFLFLSFAAGGVVGGSSWFREEPLVQESHEAASRETVQAAGNRGAAHMYDCQSDLSFLLQNIYADLQKIQLIFFCQLIQMYLMCVCVEWWAEREQAATGLSVSN